MEPRRVWCALLCSFLVLSAAQLGYSPAAAGAPPGAPAAAARLNSPASANAPDDAFTLERVTQRHVTSFTSPRPGELLLAQDGDGPYTAVVTHRDGRWSVEDARGVPNGAQIFSGHGRVGLFRERVWIREASGWRPLPRIVDGGIARSIGSADFGPSGDVYASASREATGPGETSGLGIYRFRQGRWEALPLPASAPGERQRAVYFRVVDGVLLAVWVTERENDVPGVFGTVAIWRHHRGTWRRQFTIPTQSRYTSFFSFGWITRTPDRQLILATSPWEVTCIRFTVPKPAESCDTGGEPGGAAMRADGQVVVAQRSARSWIDIQMALRDLDGRERVMDTLDLRPDPDHGPSVTGTLVEPRTNTTWVMTRAYYSDRRGESPFVERRIFRHVGPDTGAED